MWTIGDLQGPLNSTGGNKYVPFGTNRLGDPSVDSHRAFQALKNALKIFKKL